MKVFPPLLCPHIVLVPDPKPTPARIAFSIRAGWGLGTRLAHTQLRSFHSTLHVRRDMRYSLPAQLQCLHSGAGEPGNIYMAKKVAVTGKWTQGSWLELPALYHRATTTKPSQSFMYSCWLCNIALYCAWAFILRKTWESIYICKLSVKMSTNDLYPAQNKVGVGLVDLGLVDVSMRNSLAVSGHSQILSHSCGEKIWVWPGNDARLKHRPAQWVTLHNTPWEMWFISLFT